MVHGERPRTQNSKIEGGGESSPSLISTTEALSHLPAAHARDYIARAKSASACRDDVKPPIRILQTCVKLRASSAGRQGAGVRQQNFHLLHAFAEQN
jgi:hypothetical protein